MAPYGPMQPNARTLVSSVLFLDIVGYSTLGVGQQVELKQNFNAALLSAIEPVPPAERIVSDTGDGAAITILSDPERALFVAIEIFDSIGDMRVRGGVNLGPISVVPDINGRPNVVGDGINVAQRIMDFAREGELLVSRRRSTPWWRRGGASRRSRSRARTSGSRPWTTRRARALRSRRSAASA